MKFNLDDAIAILDRTPVALNSQLKDLPEDWVKQNEGAGTWSPYDVIGHLIHGEKTDWVVRTKVILFEENKEFVPFDRFAQMTADQSTSMNELLDDFSKLRRDNLNELRSFEISEDDLNMEGIHPEFGTISLRNMLSAWVAHDLGHIVQINRVMAKLYKEECGPWPKYLKVLN